LTWVTASTGLRPRIRGKGTPDDQAYDSEQTSFLELGLRPHKGTAIVITSRATKQQPFYCKAVFWQSHRPWGTPTTLTLSPTRKVALVMASTVAYFTDNPGGLNGSTQHPSRTRLAMKTKSRSLARARAAGTLPWLGFDRGQPNRSLLPGKHSRINALEGVASTG